MSDADSKAESLFWSKLTGLAKLCNVELDEAIVELYDTALSPMGYPAVNRALDRIILNRKARDPFPSIGDIRAVLSPEQDPEQAAVLIAGKIAQAVARFGHTNETKAKAFIGDVGWRVVQSSGGWLNVCSIESMSALATQRAQWTKLARAMIGQAGPDGASHALEHSVGKITDERGKADET